MFEITYFKIWILGILYKTIMHKNRFGQVYCIDLLKRIQIKFILSFYEFSTNCYEISKFKGISIIFKWINIFKKRKSRNRAGLLFAPRLRHSWPCDLGWTAGRMASARWPSPQPKVARPALARAAHATRMWCSLRPVRLGRRSSCRW
jgi:hypothetical protein